MAYERNPGRMPEACLARDDSGNVSGFRAVHVRLFGGWDSKRAGSAPWPAKGGRPHDTRWAVSEPPHPYEIKEFEVV